MTTQMIAADPAAPTSNQGVPTSVDPSPDLGRQPDGDGTFWTDSIYVTGYVTDGERQFGYLVHVLRQPHTDIVVQSVSITAEGDGRYRNHQEMLPADSLSWSTTGLDLHTPDLTWTGDGQTQHLAMTFPFGALDLDLENKGPALYYGGSGTWPMLGHQQYEYALPDLHASGSLTLDGTTYQVSGDDSWLDRQWGGLPDTDLFRWTWFNLALPGGDKVAVFDSLRADGDPGTSQAWATVRHANGSHELVPVTPLAQDAERPWTSPTTGNTYPTRWTVSLPLENTVLTIVADVLEQELPAISVYEGLCTVTGTYRGAPVNAKTYVEVIGNWRS